DANAVDWPQCRLCVGSDRCPAGQAVLHRDKRGVRFVLLAGAVDGLKCLLDGPRVSDDGNRKGRRGEVLQWLEASGTQAKQPPNIRHTVYPHSGTALSLLRYSPKSFATTA